MTGGPMVGAITPAPTDEEAAAIVAAIELAWPRSVVVLEDTVRLPAWRFSGRWWAKPVAARRDRPFY
ncbi:MAG: hypothetical protein JWL70_314 [Acidimicrobiia bacterium]|nr:hypothetical protein [Acidimicrobiia bacterium]